MSGRSSSAKTPLQPTIRKSPTEINEAFERLVGTSDVAALLEVSTNQLSFILWRLPPKKRYTHWQVKKRNGGYRLISAPTRSHRILQDKLAHVLNIVGRIRPSAHGFVADKSIVSNASMHVKQRYVLNVDLKDFFPSINFGRVRGLFMSKPYKVAERAATALAQLCCTNNGLPQGSPTSPVVSNLICARLDAELTRLAQRHSMVYTRYADDLTLSTSRARLSPEIASHDGSGNNIQLGDAFLAIVRGNGFEVNAEKTRLHLRSTRMEVTGLIVNRRPNVDRRFVAQIRAMLHAWEKHGYEAAQEEFVDRYDTKHRPHETSNRCFERVIRGKLAFLRQVRGESNARYLKLRKWFGRLLGEVVASGEPIGVETMYDVFICHASEDKQDIVAPLGAALESAGIRVWIDRGQVRWGDSITKAINEGLANSRFVLLILSESFLAKNWPEKEMYAVMADEIKTGVKRALPLVVGGKAAKETILKRYPLLADKLYLEWSVGDLGPIISALKSVLES